MIKGEKVKLFYAAISFALFLFACIQIYNGVVDVNVVAVIPLIISVALLLSYFVVKYKK